MQVSNVAQAGIQAGLARLNASAHNVANLSTTGEPSFRPVRVQQSEAEGGGVTFTYERVNSIGPIAADSSPPVDAANEAVEQMIAERDVMANLTVLRTACDMQSCTFESFG